MLQSDEKRKIEQYVNKISASIFSEAKKSIQSGMPDKQVIERVITITVNKFTPESKMIMSSTYNMMMEHTLAEPIFQEPQNKAAFYEMNILKELNSQFNFDVPNHIDYEKSEEEINEWIKIGAIVVAGGIISIPTKSLIPIGIASIVAGLMFLLLKNSKDSAKQDTNHLIEEYLNDVTKTMMNWVNTIEEYYDERIAILKRELVK